jgi:hypothetical protein
MKMKRLLASLVVPSFLLGVLAHEARAATRTVGPGKTYAKPCDAIAAAEDGDVIEIDAGTYSGDVCAVTRNGLTLRGVGGRAHLDAAGAAFGGKGIWVIQGTSTTVENVEFSGAQVADKNGAGIRQEGDGLVVRNCYFHDNEDGLLTGGNGEILVESSEFANNGAGDGYSHNMYIGHEKKFTLRGSWSHLAKIGHLVKSRADENFILGNRIMDEVDGTSSYAIDLPNGGTSYVIGNLIQQGPHADNGVILAYAEEGATNSTTDLFVVNNTFVNDLGSGTFLSIETATPAVVLNNIFLGGGTLSTQTAALPGIGVAGNDTSFDPLLADREAFDYQLAPQSPCIDKGVDPGLGAGVSLVPQIQYVHPAHYEARVTVGVIDIGAYEQGGGRPLLDGGVPTTDAATDGAGEGAAAIDGGAADAGGQGGGGCACHLGDPRAPDGRLPFSLLGLAGLVGWAGRRRP